MDRVYFISGIDTGVGKTIATALAARYLKQKGVDVITMKMVQTGNDGYSEDLIVHRKYTGGITYPEDLEFLTAPQIFHFPSSPRLAASLENLTVDTAKITAAAKTLSERRETVLIEGAGGLAVPLTDELLTVDFAKENGWPVLLVASGKLGSLNHTFLSIEALCARNMKIAGVFYNYCEGADPLIDNDSFREIQRFLAKHKTSAPVIRIPFCDGEHFPDVDFSSVFGR